VRVHVRVYSVLRRYAPGGAEAFDLDLEPGTELALALARLGLPDTVERVVLLNGRRADPAVPLADGDVVTVFPPVAGG